MKTLYVSDLDGTLLRPDARLSEYTVATLNRLIDEGMCFTYATARSLTSASVVTQGLTTQCPVIVYNGAFTWRADTGEVLDSASFTPKQAEDVLGYLLNASIYPLVYAHIDGVERVSYLAGRETEGIANYVRTRQGHGRMRPVMREADLYDGEIFYCSCIGSERDFQPAYAHFRADARFNTVMQADVYTPSDHWFELMPASATKGKAILRLKQLLSCDRIVAFGDGLNDLPMFSIADESYAVRNAADDLKRAATGVIPSNAEDGVARFLVNYFPSLSDSSSS